MSEKNTKSIANVESGGHSLDVYLHHRRFWMRRYGFEQRENKYGPYFHTEISGRAERKLVRKLKRKGISYRVYEKRYSRSSYYRTKFFNHNAPPYRCLYCHKRLRESDVTVDHIISIGKAKNSRRAQRLLARRACDSVNDLNNLAACCYRCNQRKGDKLGIWLLRANLGAKKGYWIARKLLWIIIIAALLALLYHFQPQILIHLLQIIQNIK